MPAVVVARLEDLRPLVGHQVRVNHWDYAVWLMPGGEVHVLDNACEHVGAPLVDGAITEGCVICPWHGWRYVLASGDRRTAIGDFPGLRSYRAWTDNGEVWADLPDDQLA